MKFKVLIITASLLLSSCAATVMPQIDADYLVLEKRAVIQPGHARAYIQFGEIVHPNFINKYKPICSIESNRLSSGASKVELFADTFSITKIVEASPNGYGSVHVNNSGLRGPFTYKTVFFLSSNKQPQVIKLNCSRWTATPNVKHLSLDEISQVLDGVGELVK